MAMEENRVEPILNLTYYQGEDRYSDGDVENEILEICKSGRDLVDVLKQRKDWPLLYHLSDIRENLLDWYDFDESASLFEIGSGCGAVTGLFCRKVRRVVCNDLSKRRSEVNAARNGKYGNLEILVGNFEDIQLQEKFDYVTLIGVLEYAGYYIQGKSPFQAMLRRAQDYLKPDGKLIIAIENKYGLKYWAGAPEDHTGNLYEGLEDYKNADGMRTFSKPELEKMLKEAGLGCFTFYYPMPDYKLPDTIYSDAFLPQPGMLLNSRVSYDRERYAMFHESDVFEGIVRDGQFPYFCNSYLIICEKEMQG